ncbi:peroxidase 24-like protein [Tanacetum coccineum]
MMRNIFVLLVASILVAGYMAGHGNGNGRGRGHSGGGGLKMRYYAKRCGSVLVENTVRGIVWSKVAADTSLAAKLLRLHYHDCFVRGCDGSILLALQHNWANVTVGICCKSVANDTICKTDFQQIPSGLHKLLKGKK